MPAVRSRDTLNYTRRIMPHLKRIFGDQNVKDEWDVAENSGDSFNRELYCPRLDFAIKPFNTDGNVNRNNSVMPPH